MIIQNSSLLFGATSALALYGLWYYYKEIHRTRKRTQVRQRSINPHPQQQVELQWEALRVVLKGRIILNDVYGQAKPGEICAILGPSGSGKTTLLNCLAGKLKVSPGLSASGNIKVNHGTLRDGSLYCAYVSQEDIFFSHLTVKETVKHSMRLKLDLPPQEEEKKVEELLLLLNLKMVENSIVGNIKDRGISGGEKKRLSIACELIGNPKLIFLDEPTTGLDAFQSLNVMKTLRSLASMGHTVIVTVHQPREQVFNCFDNIIVLAENELVYSGKRDSLVEHFRKAGKPLEEGINPADALLDAISIDNTSQEAYRRSQQRIKTLQTYERSLRSMTNIKNTEEQGCAHYIYNKPRTSFSKQLRILLARNVKQLARDVRAMMMRFVATVGASVIFALIYQNLGLSQASITSRQGLLQVLVNYTAMTSLVKTINTFGKERVIVERELSQGQYYIMPYLLSKVVTELPLSSLWPMICGSIVYPAAGLQKHRFTGFSLLLVLQSLSSASLGLMFGAALPLEPALEAGKAIMMISIIFGGFYFSDQTLSPYLQWFSHFSLVRRSFEGLLSNEFSGLRFIGEPFGTGKEVLHHIGISNTARMDGIYSNLRVIAVNLALTYAALYNVQPVFIEIG